TWPTTAAMPQASPSPCPPTTQPSAAATTPLPTSPTSVRTAARRPAVRRTLVVPGLPEPDRVGSIPRHRPASRALGNVPTSYARTTAPTLTTSPPAPGAASDIGGVGATWPARTVERKRAGSAGRSCGTGAPEEEGSDLVVEGVPHRVVALGPLRR